VDAIFLDEAPVAEQAGADVVIVANLVPVKNLQLVLEIARLMPQHTFAVVGDGPLRADLEDERRKRAASNVRFVGHVHPADVRRELGASPTALLEAMACGLPVVTSRANDFSAIVHPGRNGFVLEGFEPRRYVEALTALLRDEESRRAMSAANRLDAQRHRWHEVAARITDWMHVHLEAGRRAERPADEGPPQVTS
jgi:glycosyltransferase involved in cell wall biosynthesis